MDGPPDERGLWQSQVSRLSGAIDERVNALVSRPPEGARPCLRLDATCVKLCESGRIITRAAIRAVAVNGDGKRDGLGIATGPSSRRCCRTLSVKDSHRESMRLDGEHEQACSRPLAHDELVELHGFASQSRVATDLAGQGVDLARGA